MLQHSLTIEALWILICATLMLLIQRGMRALEAGYSGVRRHHAADAVTDAVLQREATTAALREAEARFRSIFENAVEGIFQTTPDGAYVIANPALARIYGYSSPEELIAQIGNIESQLYVDPQRRQEFEQEIRLNGVVSNFESQVYRRDGSVIWISETARAVLHNGEVAHYEGTVVDITERKELEQWRRQKEAADAANHAKSAFLARVSHEIRTPLNGVIGMLDILAGTPLSGRQQQQLRVARSSATSLVSLMNDLLDFSKIEAGKLELERAPFSLTLVAAEVIEAFEHVANAKNLALTLSVEGSVPAAVLGDPERVRQILVNLVNNALKFTEHGQVEVRIEAHPGQPGVTLRVRDTGIGIPENRRSRLFHDFMQVDASTSRKYGGTGLGLAICRQLVELMQGQISMTSEVGQGSEFRVDLPLQATTCDPIQSTARPAREPVLEPVGPPLDVPPAVATPIETGHRGTLLLAEDNEINQMVAVELLRQAGWQVDLANNGREAVAAAQTVAYDGILMDCQMPEMDGVEATREIRLLEAAGRLPRQCQNLIPIIAFTANAASEDRERCLAAGMNDFAVKPLVIEQLLETIDRTIGPRHCRTDSADRRHPAQLATASSRMSRGLTPDSELLATAAAGF